MDNEKLDYFKDMLLQKRNALTGIVRRTEGYGREKDGNTQDITDMAVESYTKEFMFGKSAADRLMLRNIEGALSRINGRTYGVCESCDDEINPRRLEAVPWAAMCVKCQAALEK
ncbi:MAG: TraR/DksA family transcriptional regulator [Acidobacteriota bacterium]|jgi:DnaK suppressor protein|nr:TraR/DksA family transcriptional regulator [Acidobacteriota bacterium]